MKVLLLGADGFIGRHIAFYLREQGVQVTAQARTPARLHRMGFATLQADLTARATHAPAFWQPHLDQNTHIINAAGLLTGTAGIFEAVHVKAPAAAYAARHPGTQALLISAVGIEADTAFAHWRRRGEAAATTTEAIILRAGLVLADTSYGGSSLIRALAALPFFTPVIGTGEQPFNPIHASDLAAIALECLQNPAPGRWEIGGPQTVSQTGILRATQSWLGLPHHPLLHIPLPLARRLGQIGDALSIGPISATSVAQLEQGVLAAPAALLEHLCAVAQIPQTRPADALPPQVAQANPAPSLQQFHRSARAFTQFLQSRPAGTQDLWQARLYLLKPLIRLTLAVLWLTSATLGLLTPPEIYLHQIALPPTLALILAKAGGLADAALGIALLKNWRPKTTAILQILMVLGYTLGLTLIAPALWLDPFGGLLKNLPILALLLTHLALTEER
ncbi:SDR family oxidoreductase [Cypionkella psychrotolerans]|uniref:SDR family oxidoreductase n=1 Tax=Cypionkella psychrotolerans TaxID=1678131 RepID=UPI0006B5E87C|nr:SDR family oxidoreductase [Cypionkella psychrotolerans]